MSGDEEQDICIKGKNSLSDSEVEGLSANERRKLREECIDVYRRKVDKNNENFKYLINYISLKKIRKYIETGLKSEVCIINLGENCKNIIMKENDLFTRHIISDELKDKKIEISINPKYKNKLISSSVNVTQLPMLVPPQDYDFKKKKYLPYLNPEIYHIYNSFDGIIKNKFSNKIKTYNEEKIYNTIEHLNNVRFSINKEMLNFVLIEWENEKSSFFKGYNIPKDENEIDEILDKEDFKDKKDREKKKMIILQEYKSHNSKYYEHFNTISLAQIYRDQDFYLPTFADFRGRIYPLVNYLSYQGTDLSRSLLLFSDESEPLDDKGVETIYAYLANLSGKSKASWNVKIN